MQVLSAHCCGQMSNTITPYHWVMPTIIDCCFDLAINVLLAEIKECGVRLRETITVDTKIPNCIRILILQKLSNWCIYLSLGGIRAVIPISS